MGISTSQQSVDMKKFGPNHDQTFTKKRAPRPGKTVYVARGDQIVEKSQGTDVFIMAIDPVAPNKNYDQLVQQLRQDIIDKWYRPTEHQDREAQRP